MTYPTRTALSPSNLPGLQYALNPYRGCSHGCIYCYAPDILRMSGEDEWGSSVDVKEGFPNVLAKELKRREKGIIGLGTVTDPYQEKEERMSSTRYCLEQISRKRWPTTIQTKSDLVVRDIDVLSRMEEVEVVITLTTLDEDLAMEIEPGAPSPKKRMKAIGKLMENGVRTWVFLGPIIPMMNDSEESLAQILKEIHELGVMEIQYDRLRIKPLVKERMRKALGSQFIKIEKMANDPTWYDGVSKKVEIICEGLRITCRKAF